MGIYEKILKLGKWDEALRNSKFNLINTEMKLKENIYSKYGFRIVLLFRYYIYIT